MEDYSEQIDNLLFLLGKGIKEKKSSNSLSSIVNELIILRFLQRKILSSYRASRVNIPLNKAKKDTFNDVIGALHKVF